MSLRNEFKGMGRIGSDPESGKFDNGNSWMRFSVAINNSYKKNDQWVEDTAWIDCKVFGNTADYLAGKLEKGCVVHFSAEVKQEKWTDKDGNKRSKLVFYVKQAKRLNLVKPASQGGSQPLAAQAQSPAPQVAADDDLPF